MVMMEEDFPRGKVAPAVAAVQDKDRKSGGGNKAVVVHRTSDKLGDLFVNTDPRPAKSPKVKKTKGLTGEETRLISEGGKRKRSSETASFQVVPLSYEQLIPDMLMLGVIHEIYAQSMLIVLPGRATGIVDIDDISTPYANFVTKALKKNATFHGLNEMFHVGQIVCVKVTTVERQENGPTNVRLSMNPRDVHFKYKFWMVEKDNIMIGAVKSKEDKGYVIDLGIDNVITFLPFEQAQEKADSLLTGQLVYCAVTSVKSEKGSRRTVEVSLKLGKLKSQIYNKDDYVNANALLPGMLLKTIVEEAHDSGLKLACGDLHGLVHSDHMRDEWVIAKDMEVAEDANARVLCIHPNLTTPYMSLQSQLAPMSTISKREDVSKIGSLQNVRVVSSSSRGVMVRLKDSEDKGFISLNHLGDGSFTSKEDISNNFKRNNEFPCRILKYAHFERMYLCSLKKDMIESDILNIHQVRPGEKMKFKIVRFNKGGIEVLFGHNITGFVPFSFAGQKNWLKKPENYIGKSHSGRIMNVEVAKKAVIVTLIKDLVNSDGAVICSLEEAKVGQVGHAIVSFVNEKGAVVKTIGGVTGFIPLSKFNPPKGTKIFNCNEVVKIGDVIHYKVLKIEEKKLIMKLFDKDTDEVVEETKKKSKKDKSLKRKRAESEDSCSTVADHVNEDDENGKKGKKKRKRRKNKKAKTEGLAGEQEEDDSESESEEKVTPEELDEKPVDLKIESDDEDDDLELTDVKDEPVETMDTEIDKITSGGSSFWNDNDVDIKSEEESEAEESNTKSKRKKAAAKSSKSKSQLKGLENVPVLDKAKCGGQATYWTNLMMGYISEGQIDRARSLAKEALEFGALVQKSQEALKVWKALFSLEVKFGTEDAAKDVLRDALQRTDNKYECYKMAAMTYEREKRFVEAQNVYRNQITRECGDNIDGWINFARFYFENGRLEEARDVFHAASKQSTSRNLNEANLTSRFAILEIYHGDVSKGTMLLDALLQAHPQRADIWVVYVQALIKKKEFEKTRSVFQRAFEISWKPHKVKSLLGRYKSFEEKNGNEDTRKIFVSTAAKVLGAEELSTLD